MGDEHANLEEVAPGSRTGMDAVIKQMLDGHIERMETKLDRDVLAVFGQIAFGLEHRVRDAITAMVPTSRRERLTVVLDTGGGVVEVVERMVDVIRHFYADVQFIIVDRAMSAGTIFAMSGDSIMMDYFSVLGPIDPQVVKGDRFVPALSYLHQFDRLIEKDKEGGLSSAEYALIAKLDLAELHQFEQARDLSVTLLKKWLAAYKFKEWTVTETKRNEVTPQMRAARAEHIATVLSDNRLWHSHGRGISRETLQSDDIKLKIDDLGAEPDLQRLMREYHHCLSDYLVSTGNRNLVQSRSYF